MNQSLHSAQSADDVFVFCFSFTPGKRKNTEQTPCSSVLDRFLLLFFFYYFLSRHLVAQSIPTAQMVLDHFSSFFFSCHLVAQSRHTAQSVLDHFPSFFFFHATSWLRANTLLNRSSTVYSFITPPRGSEQTCCTIAPNHFFLIIIHYYFPLTPPRGSEQKQTLAETTRPAPFPRGK